MLRLLQYNIVEGEYTTEELVSMATGGNATNATNVTTTGSTTLQTLLGENLTVTVRAGEIMVGNATVGAADLDASNGVVHTIDAVLIPENVTLGATTANQTANLTQNQTAGDQNHPATSRNLTQNQTASNQTMENQTNMTSSNQTI